MSDFNGLRCSFLTRNLLQGCMGLVLMSPALVAAGGAVDVLGVSQRIQRDLATDKAKGNQAEFKNFQEQINQFQGKGLPTLPTAGLTLPEPTLPGSLPTQSLKLDSSDQALSQSAKQSAKELVQGYQREYQSLKSLLFELAPRYDSLDETQRQQLRARLKDFTARVKTLEALGEAFPSLVERKRFAQDRSDLSLKLPAAGKGVLRELNPAADTAFIDRVKQAQEQEKKSKVAENKEAGEANPPSNQTTGAAISPDQAPPKPALSPMEQVRDACSTIIGGKDGGPALLSHLGSGSCSQALAENPELGSKFKIEKVKALLKKWQGFGVRSANLKIGIHALAQLGIQIWPGHTQAQVPDEPVAQAVKIQQQQKLLATPPPQGGASSLGRKSARSQDKAVLNVNHFTD